MVVRVTQAKLRRQVNLRNGRKRVLAAQLVARNAVVLALEHRNPRTPAATKPEAFAEDEHRVQVQARRTPEVFLDQHTRAQLRARTQVEHQPRHHVQVALPADVVRRGAVPPENVVALVARQQVHHRYPRIPARSVVVYPEADIRDEAVDPVGRKQGVAPIDRVQHRAVQAVLRHPRTQAEAQTPRIRVIQTQPERVVQVARGCRLRTQFVGRQLQAHPVALGTVRVQHAVYRQQARLRRSVQAHPLAPETQLTEPLLLVTRIARVHAHRVENILRELDVLLGADRLGKPDHQP